MCWDESKCLYLQIHRCRNSWILRIVWFLLPTYLSILFRLSVWYPLIVCLAAFATDWAGIPRICVRRFVLKIPIDIHSITRFQSSGNDSISSTNYWHFYVSWGMGKASNAESSLRTDSIQLQKITMENFSEVLLGSGLRICDWFP